MRNRERWFTLLLPVFLVVGAWQPLVQPTVHNPRLEVRGHVSGTPLTVAVRGDYAYLGFSYEFVVLDITDRSAPQWVAALPIPSNAIALAGDYAYVVGKGGFTVVNVSDPTQPQPLGHLASPATAVGVVVAADDAYFIEDRHLHQVDITDPAQPQIKRTSRLPSRGEHLTAIGGYLYVSSFGGLYIFVAAEGGEPRAVCTIQTQADVSGVVVEKGYTLFAAENILYVLAMTRSPTCRTLAQFTMPGWVSDLAVADGTLYVANGSHGLQVWDIADPVAPVAVGAYATGGLALTVAVQDGYLYLVDCNEGLRIYAIGDPTHLTLTGSFTALGITAKLAIVGNAAYLTAGLPLHLHHFDLTKPAALHTACNYPTTTPVYDLATGEERLYLLTAQSLQVISVATPTRPHTERIYPIADPTLQNLWYVVANRSHLYLGDTRGDLWFVDLAAPPQSIKAPCYCGLGQVGAMALAGDNAYLPDPGVGVRILEVAATGALTQVGLYATDETINQVAVAHGYVYLAGVRGLTVVDVHVPARPQYVTHYPLPGVLQDLSITGDYVFLAAGAAGLLVLDATNPAQPVLIATFATADCAHSVASVNDLIYVADRLGGLYILALTPAP